MVRPFTQIQEEKQNTKISGATRMHNGEKRFWTQNKIWRHQLNLDGLGTGDQA